MNFLYKFFNKKLCLNVTDTPEAIKINVLIKGTFKQSKDNTEMGGQLNPSSNSGPKKKWK